jgi:hypothetical protein
MLPGVPLDAAQADLAADGWLVHSIQGAPSAKSGFFDAVRAALPLDPPFPPERPPHWDALLDSLFGGLQSAAAEKLAITWPDSNRLRVGDPGAYATAVELLTDLVDWLVVGRPGNPRQMLVLLM